MRQFIPRLPRPALWVLGLAALGLAACGPLGMYHKPGEQVSTMNRVLTNCEVEALGKVAVDRRVERDPVRIVPRRVCDRHGNCRVFYDRFGGQVRTYDANAGLRQRVLNQCMTDAGYRYVELPACSAGVKRAAPVAATTVLPQLAPNSCAIRNDDSSWQIVTPG